MMENEKAWLVADMPDLTGAKSKEIEQHYLSDGPQPLRIRATDDAAFELTKKIAIAPGDLSRREEINIPLTRDEFLRLKTLSKRFLTKTRYALPLGDGLVTELDIFHGPLEGFTKVEVEFPDEATRAAFTPPSWFGRDISQEKWAKNSRLAGMRYEEVKKFLS